MTSSRPTTDGITAFFRTWWHRGWLPQILLAAMVIVAYQPAWTAGFIWDDDAYVTKNPLLTAPDGLRRIWFSLDSPSQYCPLVYTTFRLERGIWGLNPHGYHWDNLLLHALNAVLVWRLLRRLEVPGAWLGAALFALHPVQVESVAWISERKNVLSLCFYLLAVLAWLDWIEDRPGKPWRDYVLVLLFYALALLSKTTACTLPAALVLVLWLKQKPINRARWLQIAPFVVLGLGMGLLTMWWERFHQGTAGKLFNLTWLERLLIASRAVWFYAGKLLWPANLSFSYPRWTINPADPLAYLWLLAAAGLFVAILAGRRFVGRSVATAIGFYVATLSPLLGFIMLYTFRYSFVADHYQYVACIGPLALGAAALSGGWRRSSRRPFDPASSFSLPWLQEEPSTRKRGRGGGRGRRLELGEGEGNPLEPKHPSTLQPIFCGLLLLVLGGLTWRQCRMYADPETLWRTTLTRNPDSFMAHNNLGTALLRRDATAEAIVEFQKVLQLQPDYEIAHYDLGHALARQGRMSEAIAQFQKAVELDPNYAGAHNNLANLLLRQGQGREAITHYEAALRLRPKNADIANNLAWLLATSPQANLRDGPRAIETARLAERLAAGRNPIFTATLAAAQAEAGLFPEALATAQRALDLACTQYNTALATALSEQIALYQAGKPFRATAPPALPTW